MIRRDDNFKPYALAHTRDRIAHVFSYPAQRMLLPALLIALAIGLWQFQWGLLVAIIGGALFQYLNEYALHRFVYHMPPPPEANALFHWLYKSHIGHHDFPNNPNLWGGTSLWFAPSFAVITFVLIWPAFWLLGLPMPWLYALVFVFVGSVGLYLMYEWAHVTAHAVGDKNALERYISREHAKHHFNDFGTNFHVTAGGILIDKIGGTAHQAGKTARTRNIRTLGLSPDDARLIAGRERLAASHNITPADREKALR